MSIKDLLGPHGLILFVYFMDLVQVKWIVSVILSEVLNKPLDWMPFVDINSGMPFVDINSGVKRQAMGTSLILASEGEGRA